MRSIVPQPAALQIIRTSSQLRPVTLVPEIRLWYGQSGFRLATGDSRVLIDPFLTDRSDRRYRPPAAAADFADITLVLCTHEHVDHLDLPFLREFCAVNRSAGCS